MSNFKVIHNDTEIMNLWELLTNKKEVLFSFRSKNSIKKDNFNKYLQKLVNRLIYLDKYCTKYGIKSNYIYFTELLNIFLDIIDKNTQIDIHPDILYDIKRNTFINYFKFLYDIYKYYLEEYTNFLIKNKKYSIKIELKNVENFTKNLSNINLKSNLSSLTNHKKNCDIYFNIFNTKYAEYIEFIKIIIQLIKTSSIDKLNKDIEKNIEFLKKNIDILNKKLIDHIKKNRNDQLAINKRRNQISNEAEKRKKHEVKPSEVRNWKSMYFRGNQYRPANTLPTDPIKIEQAKIRFVKILEKERLVYNAKSCNDERQARTDENWQRCKLAENKLKQIEKENRAYLNTILPKLTNYDRDRIGQML